VLDGDPAPPTERGTATPHHFCGLRTQASYAGLCPHKPRPMSIVAKRLDGSGCAEVGLSPGDVVLDGEPALPMEKGTAVSPTCQPMSVVSKWLDGSGYHLVWS